MAAVVIVLDLSIIGCDLVSDTVPLQTVPNGPFAGNCRGVGLDGILVGSLADPRHAWVVDVGHDTRMDVRGRSGIAQGSAQASKFGTGRARSSLAAATRLAAPG
jgi:hypothetical protein